MKPGAPEAKGPKPAWRAPNTNARRPGNAVRPSKSVEPPCTDPYARWCGRGGAARLPPIPIKPPTGSQSTAQPNDPAGNVKFARIDWVDRRVIGVIAGYGNPMTNRVDAHPFHQHDLAETDDVYTVACWGALSQIDENRISVRQGGVHAVAAHGNHRQVVGCGTGNRTQPLGAKGQPPTLVFGVDQQSLSSGCRNVVHRYEGQVSGEIGRGWCWIAGFEQIRDRASERVCNLLNGVVPRMARFALDYVPYAGFVKARLAGEGFLN